MLDVVQVVLTLCVVSASVGLGCAIGCWLATKRMQAQMQHLFRLSAQQDAQTSALMETVERLLARASGGPYR